MEQEKSFLLDFAKNLFTNTDKTSNYGIVRHINGDIVLATQGLCELVGFSSPDEITHMNAELLFEETSNYTKQNLRINNEKLKNGSGIVDVLIKMNNSESLMLFSLIPINYTDGRCIGCYSVGRNTNFPSYKEMVLMHTKKIRSMDTKVLPKIELTEKERIILFLLIAGFTQEEVAEYLECSRGFIGKFIAQSMCPKFGLIGSSTKLLVQRAIYNGVLGEIPEEITSNLNAIYC